jgi:hypothetical protein
MKVLEKYDGTKTYMFPNGALATPEAVLQQFPACLEFAHIVETDVDGEVMFAMQNLAAMRSLYEIDMTLSENEAIAAIQTLINTVQEPTVSADERIAAALEYQNLLTL